MPFNNNLIHDNIFLVKDILSKAVFKKLEDFDELKLALISIVDKAKIYNGDQYSSLIVELNYLLSEDAFDQYTAFSTALKQGHQSNIFTSPTAKNDDEIIQEAQAEYKRIVMDTIQLKIKELEGLAIEQKNKIIAGQKYKEIKKEINQAKMKQSKPPEEGSEARTTSESDLEIAVARIEQSGENVTQRASELLHHQPNIAILLLSGRITLALLNNLTERQVKILRHQQIQNLLLLTDINPNLVISLNDDEFTLLSNPLIPPLILAGYLQFPDFLNDRGNYKILSHPTIQLTLLRFVAPLSNFDINMRGEWYLNVFNNLIALSKDERNTQILSLPGIVQAIIEHSDPLNNNDAIAWFSSFTEQQKKYLHDKNIRPFIITKERLQLILNLTPELYNQFETLQRYPKLLGLIEEGTLTLDDFFKFKKEYYYHLMLIENDKLSFETFLERNRTQQEMLKLDEKFIQLRLDIQRSSLSIYTPSQVSNHIHAILLNVNEDTNHPSFSEIIDLIDQKLNFHLNDEAKVFDIFMSMPLLYPQFEAAFIAAITHLYEKHKDKILKDWWPHNQNKIGRLSHNVPNVLADIIQEEHKNKTMLQCNVEDLIPIYDLLPEDYQKIFFDKFNLSYGNFILTSQRDLSIPILKLYEHNKIKFNFNDLYEGKEFLLRAIEAGQFNLFNFFMEKYPNIYQRIYGRYYRDINNALNHFIEHPHSKKDPLIILKDFLNDHNKYLSPFGVLLRKLKPELNRYNIINWRVQDPFPVNATNEDLLIVNVCKQEIEDLIATCQKHAQNSKIRPTLLITFQGAARIEPRHVQALLPYFKVYGPCDNSNQANVVTKIMQFNRKDKNTESSAFDEKVNSLTTRNQNQIQRDPKNKKAMDALIAANALQNRLIGIDTPLSLIYNPNTLFSKEMQPLTKRAEDLIQNEEIADEILTDENKIMIKNKMLAYIRQYGSIKNDNYEESFFTRLFHTNKLTAEKVELAFSIIKTYCGDEPKSTGDLLNKLTALRIKNKELNIKYHRDRSLTGWLKQKMHIEDSFVKHLNEIETGLRTTKSKFKLYNPE